MHLQTKRQVPWIEKHRPAHLDHVVDHPHILEFLKASLADNNVPNLLFYGPSGTGKTTTLLALCRQLFGDAFGKRVLELNASRDNGIDTIRDKVKQFCKQVVPVHATCPAIRFVILDEADSITLPAQCALRLMMEENMARVRFGLMCNNVNRIHDAIRSRCCSFYFKPLSLLSVANKLESIAAKEQLILLQEPLDSSSTSSSSSSSSNSIVEEHKIAASPSALALQMAKCAEGDLRRAIQLMETSAALCRSNHNTLLNETLVHQVAGTTPLSRAIRWWSCLRTNTISNVEAFVQIEFTLNAISPFQVLQLFRELLMSVAPSQLFENKHSSGSSNSSSNTTTPQDDDDDDADKWIRQQARALMKCAQTEYLLCQGHHEALLLLDLCLYFTALVVVHN